jgi:hypothetical protein
MKNVCYLNHNGFLILAQRLVILHSGPKKTVQILYAHIFLIY